MHEPESTDRRVHRTALVRIRRKMRIPQVQLAQAVGVNRSSLSLWEHGFQNLPEPIIAAIAEYLREELETLQDIEVNNASAVSA